VSWVPIEEAAAARGLSGGDLADVLQHRVVVRNRRNARLRGETWARGIVAVKEGRLGVPWWAVKTGDDVAFVSHVWGPDVDGALAAAAAEHLEVDAHRARLAKELKMLRESKTRRR